MKWRPSIARSEKTWNDLVAVAREEDVKVSKDQIREMFFSQPKKSNDLIKVYREAAVQGYDFEKDADGLLSWDFIGTSAALANPLEIGIKQPKTIEDLRTIVTMILTQFKKNIEENRLYEFLYKDDGKREARSIRAAVVLCSSRRILPS